MRYLTLPDSPPMSVLGFGCAALLGRSSRKESETAIGTALDAGITFFDTARSYGYGESEGLLGSLLEGRRQQVIVCTKFGILPAERSWRSQLLPVARKMVKTFPGLRRVARTQSATQFTSGQFSVATLAKSLEMSLRALRTDYVDMLLMHSAPESVLAQEDLLEALGRLVESGKVRRAGVSAGHPVISKFFSARPRILTMAQFPLNAPIMGFTRETEKNGDLLLVANHPYGGPSGVATTRLALESMADSEDLPNTLRTKIREGARDRQMLPELLLNLILKGTGVAAVVTAMMQSDHCRRNVQAVTDCRFSVEELVAIRGVLAGSSN